jgi:protein-tyrosine phosphatase
VHDPVSDNLESEYCDDLFRAALKLYELRDIQGKQVFLNCTAGVSRAPTLILVYMALFIRHESWRNIVELYGWLEEKYEW